MRKSYRHALLLCVGALIFVVMAGVAGGLWFFATHFDFTPADGAAAERSFSEVRQRFASAGPILDFVGREMRLLRPVPTAVSSRQVHTVRVLVWTPDDRNLARIALPLWLLRMSDDPIKVSIDAGEVALLDTSLTVEDIERYGPTLVVDHQDAGGERILVWTE